MNIGLKWVKNFFIISNWRTLIRAVGGGEGRGGGGNKSGFHICDIIVI